MPAFIQLRSGAFLDLDNPAPRLITLADIAYATARICRYTGHTSRHTSVAEHSVHVSLICPPEVACHALLHDAAEAYVGDVSGPLKRLLPDFVVVEQRVRAAVAERFGLGSQWQYTDPLAVKAADLRMLAIEARAVMGAGSCDATSPWGSLVDESDPRYSEHPAVERIGRMPDEAHAMFLARARELGVE